MTRTRIAYGADLTARETMIVLAAMMERDNTHPYPWATLFNGDETGWPAWGGICTQAEATAIIAKLDKAMELAWDGEKIERSYEDDEDCIDDCPGCGGRGMIGPDHRCPTCSGRGF